MSGPKVVRVVTKEELIAQCESAMFNLEAVCDDLRTTAKRLEYLTDALDKSIEIRCAEMRGEIAAGRVHGLHARIVASEQFARSEKSRVMAVAKVRLEQQRSKDRLALAGARTIANALQATNVTLAGRIRTIANGPGPLSRERILAIEAVVAEGYAALRVQSDASSTKSDTDLARRLAEGVGGETLSHWISTHVPLSKEDPRLQQLLVQIELVGSSQVDIFRSRAAAIEGESDGARRTLLMDSLVIELAEAVRAEERLLNLRVRSEVVRLKLSKTSDAISRSALAQLDKALRVGDAATQEAALARAEESALNVEQAAVADFRRRAVLSGLAKLGYQVNETMEAAWSQNGRIVVAKPSVVDYGVELGATPNGQTMQVRLVGSAAPSSPRSPERDSRMESTWCAEFSKLQELVSLEGSELQIKRAIGVGVEAVRSVDTSDIERARIANVSRSLESAGILKG